MSRLALLAVVAALASSATPAAASPVLTPSPASLNFGNGDTHTQNTNRPTLTVDLKNVGTDAVRIQPATITGAGAASFVIAYDNCQNQFLGPGGGCPLGLRFVPTELGPLSATLEIVDDSGTTEVPLAGNGITGTLTASPDALTFDPRPWYQGGQSLNVHLDSGSDAGVRTSSATISGPGASAFYVANGSNCFNQFFNPNNGCDFGVGFQAPSPGTYTAQLELTSDGTTNPLVIPLKAVALNGPHLRLTPNPLAFGDVPVGQAPTRTVTVVNDGDYPGQVGETLTVTGRPDVFAVTADTCEGQIIVQGTSCAVTVRFRPAFAGPADASLFLIAGDGRRPVEVVGLSGTGVGGPAPPAAAAALAGHAVANSALRCVPNAPASAIAWLRNGVIVPGAIGSSLALRDADVGARFACRATIAGVTVASAPSASVQPRSLAGLRGAFVDTAVCRSATAPSALTPGGRTVRIAAGRPATVRAPLVLRSAAAFSATIDGRRVGFGRRVAVSPRTLAGLRNGAHRLRVTAGGSAATGTLSLASCQLALQVTGGPGRTSVVAVSARYGVHSVSVRLSGLHVATANRFLGQLVFDPAGLPQRKLELVGARSNANGVTVELRRGRLLVTGLPPEVGVVRFRLRGGVLRGSGGSGVATATLRGATRPTTARAPAAWQR